MKISRRTFVNLGLGGIAASAAAGSVTAATIRRGTPPDLLEWLNANANVRDSINWLVPNAKTYSADKRAFSAWEPDRQLQLVRAYQSAWNGLPSNVVELPTNLEKPPNLPTTVMTPEQAWNYFKASVAQGLALEIGSKLPWSIKTYSNAALTSLFDADKLFIWDADLMGYRIRADYNGYFTPGPPELSLRFLNQIGAISIPGLASIPEVKAIPAQTGRLMTPILLPSPLNARKKTIARLFDWGRYYLLHFAGDYEFENMKAHWQYPGMPPISRVIKGTVNQAFNSTEGNWTAGCYGTTGFLTGVLKAVNIPVQERHLCGHSIAHFIADDLYLSHSDDIYNGFSRPALNKGNLPFASLNLLINGTQFKSWFGEDVEDRCNNVGRNPAELGVKYLSPNLVQAYASDKAQNKSHADGSVFENLQKYYTLTELENMKLWEKLEAKLAASPV